MNVMMFERLLVVILGSVVEAIVGLVNEVCLTFGEFATRLSMTWRNHKTVNHTGVYSSFVPSLVGSGNWDCVVQSHVGI